VSLCAESLRVDSRSRPRDSAIPHEVSLTGALTHLVNHVVAAAVVAVVVAAAVDVAAGLAVDHFALVDCDTAGYCCRRWLHYH
jgi:hypothetical protein